MSNYKKYKAFYDSNSKKIYLWNKTDKREIDIELYPDGYSVRIWAITQNINIKEFYYA